MSVFFSDKFDSTPGENTDWQNDHVPSLFQTRSLIGNETMTSEDPELADTQASIQALTASLWSV